MVYLDVNTGVTLYFTKSDVEMIICHPQICKYIT